MFKLSPTAVARVAVSAMLLATGAALARNEAPEASIDSGPRGETVRQQEQARDRHAEQRHSREQGVSLSGPGDGERNPGQAREQRQQKTQTQSQRRTAVPGSGGRGSSSGAKWGSGGR